MELTNDKQLIVELIDLLSESVGAIKVAHMEKAALEAELAKAKSPVVLEKVAADAFDFMKLANVLVDHSVLAEDGKQKFVASLKKDPTQLVGVIKQALTLSAPFPSEGQGVPKSAHARGDSDEEDSWNNVVVNGA